MDKPKRGNCGSCQWWEFAGAIRSPNGDEVRNGFCMVNPPVPVMVATPAPGSALSAGGPRMIPGVQGMLPPQTENGRCAQWRAAGMLPDAAMEIVNAN